MKIYFRGRVAGKMKRSSAKRRKTRRTRNPKKYTGARAKYIAQSRRKRELKVISSHWNSIIKAAREGAQWAADEKAEIAELGLEYTTLNEYGLRRLLYDMRGAYRYDDTEGWSEEDWSEYFLPYWDELDKEEKIAVENGILEKFGGWKGFG